LVNSYRYFGKQWEVHQKTKNRITFDSIIHLWVYIQRIFAEIAISAKYLYFLFIATYFNNQAKEKFKFPSIDEWIKKKLGTL
jgi:hypothetical protein